MTDVPRTGTVYLVGAGPGDPGLLTLRGRECLEAADVVLYDGLVSPLLLRHTQATCERTSRAAGPNGKRIEQAEINARLIAAAKAGKTVVRLKGGDPFLFGRGSEEAAALAAEGIPFEVVPGVTAAIAAATYAGLSLTHREIASSVAFITGHEHPAKPGSSLDYEALARFPGTLVFYMGLHRLGAIAAALIAAGKKAETPACVVSRATTPLQRTVEGALGDLAALVRDADLHAPSLIVVGECVRQRQDIAWFEHKPLLGKRVGVTRPEHQADGVVDALLKLGAQPVLMPLVEILPPEDWAAVDRAIAALPDYDWHVFTSANGVDGFLGRLWERGDDLRTLAGSRIAAIGPATVERLRAFHLRADVVPHEYRAEGLVEALRPLVAGQRVLWAGADRGRDVLQVGLEAAGATVEKIVVYRSCDASSLAPDVSDLLTRGELDWVGLSSPSIARRFAELLPADAKCHLGTRVRLAAISPVTAEAAREAGLPIAAEAQDFTWNGVLRAILQAG
ncbi:MAG: uroporphyrinogen-III C-methyltransferase [Planctomycetota bacterium]|nr:uroporphyrinogen-III C-methyltransferase [Planctomycetaceae bacterium]MDQ3329925.1 uroporphyrinogen-III C-methyltransferase [Planctomycetota bacterium]